ncbi:MAG: hypothetical protein D6731_14895 [Planctomycetota bacterium]|nr:MAG: hypothetical protein D6731_14895 [Planctomycetota bacterium]
MSGRAWLRWLCVFAALGLGASLGLATRTRAPGVAEARAFYARQPRYLRPVPSSPVPRGLPDVRAETCGGCHRAIYAEWRVSTHARAWLDDPQFQEELKKTRASKDGDASWMCVNCHTPYEDQLERLVVGLVEGHRGRPATIPNPRFDPALQREAITCATCHVRDGVVLGPWGDTSAPHPVRRSEELLGPAVCTQCHQASATFPELNLACAFETGREHAEGPHAATPCQECHMPAVRRPLTAQGTPPRRTRRHWFGGSLIPKRPEFEAELAPLRAVYPDGLTARWVDPPARLPSGRTTELTLEIENAHAGHRLPTGDPERFLLVEAEVRDPEGAVLARRSERIGTVYRWDPPVQKLSDNRLAPGERRRFTLRFVPSAGPLTLRLVCSKWRISQENLRYHHLEGRTVPGRVFFEDTRQLPVGP